MSGMGEPHCVSGASGVSVARRWDTRWTVERCETGAKAAVEAASTVSEERVNLTMVAQGC
jgi:hypothetical protein